MDAVIISAIASTAVSLLVSFLKSAVEGLSTKAGEEIGSKTGNLAWEKARQLNETIKAKFSSMPESIKTLDALERDPNDQDTQAALRFQLRDMLTKDEKFAKELAFILKEASEVGADTVFQTTIKGNVGEFVQMGNVYGYVTIQHAQDIEAQLFSRQLGFDKAKRKLIVKSINVIRDILDDYEKLFSCEYPELREFVFAYDELNPKSPYYEAESPMKVYRALVEYKSIRKNLDNKKRLADESLDILDANGIINHEKSEGVAFPSIYTKALLSNPISIIETMELLSLCDVIIFKDFPDKATTKIEWDRLDLIKPQDVRQIIHTRLQTRINDQGRLSHDIDKAQQDREIALSEARENLVYFRNKAFQLIQKIGLELNRLKQEWIVPV